MGKLVVLQFSSLCRSLVWIELLCSDTNVLCFPLISSTPTGIPVNWWEMYSVVALEHQATNTTTWWYPTQSHFLSLSQPYLPCSVLIMLIAWLGSGKYQFLSQQFDLIRVWTWWFESRDLLKWETDAQLIHRSHLIISNLAKGLYENWVLWYCLFCAKLC